MYEFSKSVKMHPWVGEKYKASHPKLLILGESLYDQLAQKDTVIEMIKRIMTDENYAFFTKLGNVFSNPEQWEYLGGDNYKLNKEKFWNDVAFYEYIQKPLSHAKEIVPPNLWEEAVEPFKEVLEFLQPDVVVALGYDTFEHLPVEGEGGKVYKGKKEMPTRKYKLRNGKEVIVCGIQHPSSVGFSNEQWIKHFGKFLKDQYNIVYE